MRIRLLHSSGRTDITFPTAVCTFSLRTCLKRVKDREPLLPVRRYHGERGEGGGAILGGVTSYKEKSEFLLASHRRRSSEWTCRRDALWLLRRNKRFIMMLQYLGNSFLPLVRRCTCSEKRVWGCALRGRVGSPRIDPLICTSRGRPRLGSGLLGVKASNIAL